VVLPMFTTEETLLGNFAVNNPGYLAETAWHTYADPEKLSKANFARARDDLIGLHRDVEPLGGASFSPLSNLLDDYRDSASYQQAPSPSSSSKSPRWRSSTSS